MPAKSLEEELLYVMESLSMHPPVVWLESGLHNNPAHLHERLQEELDKITGQELVIMAFGFCGNSVLHLKTGNYTLILPRVDDCISLLLGSVSVKAALNHTNPTYFLSKGWMKGERNIWVEYQYTVKKYGIETGREIFMPCLAITALWAFSIQNLSFGFTHGRNRKNCPDS